MPKLHPVDVHVGGRMRQRRSLVRMSQRKLGGSVGLTMNQIKKHERGTNRISSSRLYEFAKLLEVPVSYFFDDMPSNALSSPPMSDWGDFGEVGTPFEQRKDLLSKRETLELVQAYHTIQEERLRTSILATIRAVGQASDAKLLAARRKR